VAAESKWQQQVGTWWRRLLIGPAGPVEPVRDPEAALFATIRTLRADAQEFQGALDAVVTALAAKDPSADAERTAATDWATQVQKHFAASVGALDQETTKADGHVRHFADSLETIKIAAARANGWAATQTSADATAVIAALDGLVEIAEIVTLPGRVNDHLRSVPVGETLDFAANFNDELPRDATLRQAVINYLAGHPRIVDGVFDVTHGLIYKKARSRFRRVCTYLTPAALAIVVAPAVLVLVSRLDDSPFNLVKTGWSQLDSGRALVGTYALVLVGAIIHLVVERSKLLKFGDAPIYVPAKGLDWLQLHWLGLSASLLPVLLVVVALHLTGQTDDFTCFLAGYGVDSVAGLVVSRLGTASQGTVAALGTALGGQPAAAAPAAGLTPSQA
jgi:hypothetical protein